MRKLTLLLVASFAGTTAFACEVCKRNQPKVLQGYVHGAGPGGTVDYIIMFTAIGLVAIALFLSIKYLIKPNEDNLEHIKNIVTNEGF